MDLLFCNSILKLGLKVTKPIYGVNKSTLFHVLGDSTLRNVTELYNSFVDKKINHYSQVDERELQYNERIVEQ